MLDLSIKEQLKSHFQSLDHQIELVVDRSDHERQAELLAMLAGVASTSDAIVVRLSDESASVPSFRLHRDGKPTGVKFVGIPGGHEFSSLVLAILNASWKGRLPDAGLTERIKRLRGGATVQTFISLTCESCPDVVQALNQIALVHEDLTHVMVDGQFAQEELAKLNVQGVPSVIIDGKLVHSGRATLADLLAKLEGVLGTSATLAPLVTDLGHFDVAVLGGGPAGASAAIYSVRKGLKTVIIAERMGGQLQETKGIENLVSVVYTEGPRLSANLDEHLRSYPVEVLEHRRIANVTTSNDGPKRIELASGERLSAEAIVVATGAKWRELGVAGERDYIGRGVAFCPHCDGPFYKGRKVAVVGGGNSGVEAAIDLAGICSDVTLFEYADKLKADEVLVKKLKTLANVSVVLNAKPTAIIGNGAKVVAMTWQDRIGGDEQTVALDAVFVQIGLSPNSGIVKDLVDVNQNGEIIVDAKGRTSSPGIYAAGDVTTVPFKQIVVAMGEGAKVALTAFEDRVRAS